MPNHLANENSPYLLQHANNPVDWYPWNQEALARARQENKIIFVSIGYAACHWCHVMEHESFENEAIAALMNERFINIKVDREERPDLDNIYMTATLTMNSSGGWPLSVFLTPELQPFYAGTYFPPERRPDMPAFRDVLIGVSQTWQDQPEEIYRVGALITEQLRRTGEWNGNAAWPLTHAALAKAADLLCQSYDWSFGGWGGAPKFPQPMAIDFLLGQTVDDPRDLSQEARQRYKKTASHALHAMARGGMFDVVGGGFARYSVDNLWKTPHFEKMLFDNAQLAQTYLHAYLITGEVRFRQICEQTLDFLLREMSHPAGGFFSSLDADSEGQEGKFYVWNYSEIQMILGPDFEFFKQAYGLSPDPALANQFILQRALDDLSLVMLFNLQPGELTARLYDAHARLLEARNRRIRPATDDKIMTFWNALTLAAFAEAGHYLSRPDYLDVAARNAHFLLDHLHVNGRLLRSWRAGTARHNAYLEDYASLILGLLALYQAFLEPEWYSIALQLADEMVAHFSDPQGGFFDTRDDHETLLLRPKDILDNATPSGNSLAAKALLQIVEFGDRPEWRKLAEDMLPVVLETAQRYPTALAKWLSVADFALGPTRQVVVIGDPQLPETQALLAVLRKKYQPRQVTALSNHPPAPGSPALLKDRPLLNGLPTAYVCQGFTCQQPVNSPEALAAQLAGKTSAE
jgi:uncharacterized protein YyaL (SSP411 family)